VGHAYTTAVDYLIEGLVDKCPDQPPGCISPESWKIIFGEGDVGAGAPGYGEFCHSMFLRDGFVFLVILYVVYIWDFESIEFYIAISEIYCNINGEIEIGELAPMRKLLKVKVAA